MLASRVEAKIMTPKITYTSPSQPSAVLAKIKRSTLRIKVESGGIKMSFLVFLNKKTEVKNKIPARNKMRNIKNTCSIEPSFLVPL